MSMRWYWVGSSALLGAALAASCTHDFDQFDFEGGLGGQTTSGPTSASSAGGAVVGCKTIGDCQGQNTTCKPQSCNPVSHMCENQNEVKGKACTEGGKVCDGMGNCVECNADTDCTTAAKPVCANNTCVAPACNDTKLNGMETDLDCGGPVCAPCINGKKCVKPSDCQSSFCQPQGGGGGAGGMMAGPGTCAPCGVDADCKPAGQYYCKMMVCAPQGKNGDKCIGGNECQSGFCADGVCCDTKCDEVCAACVAAKNGGVDGTCGAVKATTDPDTECAMSAKTSCGANGTGCSGTIGACNLWDATTQCAAASCNAAQNQQSASANCDAKGKCDTQVTKKCDPYVCGATACLTNCTTAGEADCLPATYCDGQACQTCGTTVAATGTVAMCPAACTGGCPMDGICNVDCAGNTCANVTCPPGYNCFVNCNNGKCSGGTITCPDKHNCSVNCQGAASCQNATIKATGTGKVSVKCSADAQVCDGVNVTCGVNACDATCAGASKPTLGNCGNMPANACSCTPC
jgi:hypothetical protein